jgi:hypothetical protein
MAFNLLMEHSADIYEVTNNVDAFGTPLPFQLLVSSGVPCRLVQLTTGESVSGGRERARGSHKIFIEGEIEWLTEKHFIVIDEARYDIKYVYHVQDSGSIHHLEIYVQEDADSRQDSDDETYFIYEEKKRLKDDFIMTEDNLLLVEE